MRDNHESRKVPMIEFNTITPLYDYDDVAVLRQQIEAVESCRSTLTYQALSSPASAFSLNIQAIDLLLDMPFKVSLYSQGWGASDHNQFAQKFLADKSLFGEDLKAAWKKHVEDKPPIYNLIPNLIDSPDENINIQVALESLLSMITTAGWTALETLAKDVWIGAVNSFPEPLARRALDTQSEGLIGGDEQKSIKAAWIAKYGFDLRDCMGTLLAEDESRFKFSSPDQIVRAYKATFREFGGISRMWIEIKKDLNLLNLSRNLIVHRAGIIDERFNKQTKHNLPVGERLPLNTQNVCQFVSLAAMAGCELLTLCEAWLSEQSD